MMMMMMAGWYAELLNRGGGEEFTNTHVHMKL